MFNKSFLYVCALALGALVLTPAANAQNASKSSGSASGVFMAVLDMDVVLAQSKALKTVREQIAKHQSSLKAELEKEKAEFDKAGAELMRKKNLQTGEQFKVEEKKFQEKVNTWKRHTQQRNLKLAQVRTKATSKIDETITAVVKGLVEKNNITIVFDKRATFYAHPTMNITKLVSDELNARLPSVSVENPWKK